MARIALLQLPAYDLADARLALEDALRRIDDVARSHGPLDLIVLPEASYPAYFFAGNLPADAPSPGQAAARFAAKAAEHGVYLAAGIAIDDGGRRANSALLFDRQGELAGRYEKAFLWHFDANWFARGGAYPVFETDFGRVGMLICADGRIPEIARALVAGGAQLIVDLTAWVSGGRHAEELTTTQFEYLMRVRAYENGVWVVCADKCGTEAESIVYAGRSCVIAPDGSLAAALGTDEAGALVYDVPLADAAPPVARRPKLYGVLAEDPAPSPRPTALGPEAHRLAAAQTGADDALERHLARQALMHSELVVFPCLPDCASGGADEVAARLRAGCLAGGMLAAVGLTADGVSEALLVGGEGVVARHRQSHGRAGAGAAALGDALPPTVDTPLGRLGLLVAEEGLAPEPTRALMLRGADIILWCAAADCGPVLPVARTRAEENRVYVAVASPPSSPGGASAVIDPDGRILAVALAGRELVVGADVVPLLARNKRRAPGTDVLADRQPATYGILCETAATPAAQR
jgi:predicted amidohydrolase